MPEKVVTVELEPVFLDGLKCGIETGEVERAAVAHNGIVLHRVAPGHHLEVAGSQFVATVGTHIDVLADTQSEHVVGMVLGVVGLEGLVVGEYLFHLQGDLSLGDTAPSVRGAPFHDLVLATSEQHRRCYYW